MGIIFESTHFQILVFITFIEIESCIFYKKMFNSSRKLWEIFNKDDFL